MTMSKVTISNSYCDTRLSDKLIDSRFVLGVRKKKTAYKSVAYFVVFILTVLTAICVVLPVLLTLTAHINDKHPRRSTCNDNCTSASKIMYPAELGCISQFSRHVVHHMSLTIVESIPYNLTYPAGSPSSLSTFEAWCRLIDNANKTIDIASFYWTLRGQDVYKDPSDWQGEMIFEKLLSAVKDRGIKLRIVQNQPNEENPDQDTVDLKTAGADVRTLNFTSLIGSGILHTKFWIVDNLHVYVGSANMDWRSLTQVKELGAVMDGCPCFTADASKLFDVYWYLGAPNVVPAHWPDSYATQYNNTTPMSLTLNNTRAMVYLSFCPRGRTVDIDAILDIIEKAQQYIYIAVMDYSPTISFSKPQKFWPVIDDALRKASLERGVHVCLLASEWNHTAPSMKLFLQSLQDVSGAMNARIETRLFRVPSTAEQAEIPFGRVNHNKYMVTDNAAYIGTSNWSGDYFVSTGGVGLIVNETSFSSSRPGVGGSTWRGDRSRRVIDSATLTVQQQLTAIFRRDWNSTYSHQIK